MAAHIPSHAGREITRIIVTSDFLRVAPNVRDARSSFQNATIEWLYNLLSWPLWRATGIEPEKYLWSEKDSQFDGRLFYEYLGRDPSVESWIQTFDGNFNIPDDCLNLIAKDLSSALVIGFEISPLQRKILCSLEIPYISLCIHPVRFLDDLLFAMEASDPESSAIIQRQSVPEERFYAHARFLKASLIRKEKLSLEEDCALFCGQVGVDASLIEAGSLRNPLDYFDKILGLSNSHSHLYFKPHPYSPQDTRAARRILALPNSSLIDGNIYRILADDAVRTVAAISSSVLTEAKYFEKSTVKLKEGPCTAGNGAPIDGRALDADFWRTILSPLMPTNPGPLPADLAIPSPIQSALVTSWKKDEAPASIDYELISQGQEYDLDAVNSERYIAHGASLVQGRKTWISGSGCKLRARLTHPMKVPLIAKLRLLCRASETVPISIAVRSRGHLLRRSVQKAESVVNLNVQIPPELLIQGCGVEIDLDVETVQADFDSQGRWQLVCLEKFSVRPVDSRIVCFLGECISFAAKSGANFALHTGWGGPEELGKWTVGAEARMGLRLIERPASDIALTFEDYSIFQSSAVPVVSARFSINGETIETRNFADGRADPFTLRVPRGKVGPGGEIDLQIRMIGAHSPLDAGISADPRVLGLFLRKLKVDTDLCAASMHILPGAARAIPSPDIDPLPLDMTVSGAELSKHCHFVSGWSAIEDDGIWSIRKDAHLQLRLPETDGAKDLLIEGLILRGALGQKRTVRGYVNGSHLATAVVSAESSVSLRLPVGDRSGKDLVSITLTIDELVQPMELGLNSDNRTLGIYLTNVRATRSDAITKENVKITVPRYIGTENSFRVAVVGPHRTSIGLGVMTRNTMKALASVIGPERVLPVNYNQSAHAEIVHEFGLPKHNSNPEFSIICLDAPRIADFASENPNWLEDRYSICYGAWELSRFPDYLCDTKHIDEYIGISSFVAEGARAKMRVPVGYIPLAIDVSPPTVLSTRAELGLPDDRFLFLYTFCVDSTLARKNPLAAVAAFQSAFPEKSTPASLVLKTKIRQADELNRREYARLKEIVAEDPRIILLEQELTADQIKSLFLSCDAYISLHRAEGFGLTIAEAMGFGLPAIATGYSGNLDFMTPENSALVPFELREMQAHEYHRQLQLWAEPDVSEASRLMRRIYQDEVFAYALAKRGQYEVLQQLSPNAIGKRFIDRLIQITRGG